MEEPATQNSATHGEQLLKTSVAMCTYNGAKYLAEQLESIARQTQQPGEVVVCDDGSTDETVFQINEFSRRVAFPVRLHSNHEKLGPAKNFEKAIGLCRGEVIILSDQDDVWEPGKIEKLWDAFKSQPAAYYAFSDAEIFGNHDGTSERTLWGGLRLKHSDFAADKQVAILLKENVVTGAGLAIRSSFRDLAFPIPAGWMHDYWIALLGSSISDGVPVPETLYKYRRHSAQACGWKKTPLAKYVRTSLNTRRETLQQKLCEFQELIKRLDSLAVIKPTGERMKMLKEKEYHLLRRATIRSESGFSRIGKVLAEALSGRYRRFSSSNFITLSSIFRDLTPI